MGGERTSGDWKRKARSNAFHRFLLLRVKCCIKEESWIRFSRQNHCAPFSQFSVGQAAGARAAVKRAESEADCSFCLPRSKKSRSRPETRKRRRVGKQENDADPHCQGCRYVEGEEIEGDSEGEAESLFEASMQPDAPRSAAFAVEAQLELSSNQHHLDAEKKAECRNLLQSESAKEAPSHFAAFSSMTSGSCLLFKRAQLDALNALDLGTVREFFDKARAAFLKRAQAEGARPKARLVKEPSLRMRGLAMIAHVSKRSPLKSTEGKCQSGMAGSSAVSLLLFFGLPR